LHGAAAWCRILAMMRKWDAKLQDLLSSLKDHFEVHELDLPESPVFIAVAIPTRETVTGLRPRLPAGRGLSAAQAMLSAAAESLELLASLAQSVKSHQDRFRLKNGFSEILAQNISGGSAIYFSAQRIYLDWAGVCGEPLIYDADSNGTASGSSWQDAVGRATLECIERDAMAIWWYGRQQRQHLPASCLDRYAPRLSWWLSKRQKQFRLIDITSENGVPVVAAVSYDNDGRYVAIGSAAAVSHEQAAISAVTEMVQMEVSMMMQQPDEELDNWFAKASVFEMPQFQAGPIEAKSASALCDPQQQLVAAGHQIFAVDLTRGGDLLSTARVIVPSLSALHRAPDTARIVAQSLLQPQFNGIKNAAEIETLSPY
jgi:ribosomal protein S12 methylthiotransferase accessory factor YcaO